MNRRSFSQAVALGAGTLGAWCNETSAGDGLAAATVRSNQASGTNSQTGTQQAPDRACVADYQELAKAKLPRATYEYVTTGTTEEITLRENVAAFQRLKLYPPLLTGVAEVDTATTVLQQPIALPILLAPVAGQSLFHADGVLASARAAAAAKTILGMSSGAGHSVEEVAAASDGPKWFQIYMPKDRVVARRLIERVDRSGFKAIVLTVDLGERKDADKRNRFALPEPTLRKHLRDIGFTIRDNMSYAQMLAFNNAAWDLTMSWDIFGWMRSISRLPLLIKGVLRPDDARKAVSLGLNGIVVSNHGGRRLDGMPASIDQLPSIVEAVNGRAEVLLDSGVRRGTDVLKALALGAKAVLIGRPYAWALAADGEAGVAKVLDLLREELISAMLACGCRNVREVHRSLLVP
ncbi:MAG: alpha-hydroxy-acid oxidizing protein [Acidimicrobiia bacterium]|nr:alpha-hydroxy-acid oxidizing protein [Acidimicrobiia bacterium]